MKNNSRALRIESLAGASISLGLIILIDQVLGLIYGFTGSVLMEDLFTETLFAYVALHTLSGLVSGYLVGRKIEVQNFQTSILTSFLAYIFESLYYQLLIGKFEGVWSLISLMVGGLLGSFFAKSQKERKTLSEATK